MLEKVKTGTAETWQRAELPIGVQADLPPKRGKRWKGY